VPALTLGAVDTSKGLDLSSQGMLHDQKGTQSDKRNQFDTRVRETLGQTFRSWRRNTIEVAAELNQRV